ncbi:MAG: diacylglycerol kinase [Neisseriaceae bacterium]|nr:diacylglycerol kinase [Neisseriaceae bacterium]
MTQKEGHFRHFLRSCKYSIFGLAIAYTEIAIRQLLLLNIVLCILLCCLDFDFTVKMILLTAGIMTLVVELINTAIEAAVDHTSLEHHHLAKRAKDTSSAAQMVMLILLTALWGMAVYHRYFI